MEYKQTAFRWLLGGYHSVELKNQWDTKHRWSRVSKQSTESINVTKSALSVYNAKHKKRCEMQGI